MDSLEKMRCGEKISSSEQLLLLLRLSTPAILAQISTIIMEYIDASMVGSLGASSSAAIGIVSTTTWLIGGLTNAIGTGFTINIAHKIGAGDDKEARKYVKTGLLTVIAFSLILMLMGILIHKKLPLWLGGSPEILQNASDYFLVFALTLPIMQINYTGASMLECSGNMKTPGMLNIISCFLDVIFNAFFIYPSRNITILGKEIYVPGADLGVLGAALGTSLATLFSAFFILLSILVFSEKLHLRKNEKKGLSMSSMIYALKMSFPVMISSSIMGFAYVVSTLIVAPLGNISITANSFSITAESLCYMPGYGIAHAATTLVGQTKGAGRLNLEKRFAFLSVLMGMIIMTLSGVLLFILAPWMIGLMSPDPGVRELGTTILRIEAFAEPMFGASIVSEGVFRGIGKTGIPSCLNLISMWLVRLPLSAFAANFFGLKGVWYVMCAELCFRGSIFIIALIKTYHSDTV
ncbi:MAG: MATE family efflux transporter [Lachnospiraceae bacterium]|nr:MATE family efflux transporter [Lachnospiraceae bacterium]